MSNIINNRKQKFYNRLIHRNINGNDIKIINEKLYINKKQIFLNEYKFIHIIGSGANGVVFKVIENTSELDRALKLWLPNLKQGKSNKTRSEEEIKKLSKLDDEKSIVRYYHSGKIQGYTYCTMEHIEGITLSEKLNLDAIKLSHRYEILDSIIKGLRFAHERDLYHGDMHLDNILISNDNQIKLVDFGTSHFSGKESSIRRDSKYMFDSAEKILGDYACNSIIDLHGKKIEDYEPHIVRIIIKAYMKILVLLDHAQRGMTDGVIEGIVLFSTTVPFFNINNIVQLILEAPGITQKHIDLFKTEFAIKVCDISRNIVDLDEVYNNSINLYIAIYIDFMKKSEYLKDEANLYRSYRDAKIFNENLYGDASEDEIKDEKDEIRKLLNRA